VGIGYAADAADFGDLGANTMKRISASEKFSVPTLLSLGLGNIDGVDYLPKADAPRAAVARLIEKSRGKDTTTGHWEMTGIISERPLPTYPNGFPSEVICAFEKAVGRGTLCNLPYSGTDVIRDYGEEHVKTGKLIVYTSADSVFQIAAHEDVVPLDELYRICQTARELLQGEHGVGRVIARPFTGCAPDFKRTANRRDFSLQPPHAMLLDELSTGGLDVIGVGKIGDIFCMQGMTESFPSHGNAEGMEITTTLAKRDFHGLCFVNLVDFDMLYGHRQDVIGYTRAINAFDAWLGEFLPQLREDDALIITADHGCDPSDESTDHTRECVPLLLYQKGAPACDLGTTHGFDYVGKTVLSLLK
jgi:phosphopentomutase